MQRRACAIARLICQSQQNYKSFVRPHLDYGDIIYDKAFIGPFQKKLESIQYNAALAITGSVRGTSREKIYSELGVESLDDFGTEHYLFFIKY